MVFGRITSPTTEAPRYGKPDAPTTGHRVLNREKCNQMVTDYTHGVATQLADKLAEARSAPLVTSEAEWFGDVVLDDVRDDPDAAAPRTTAPPAITLPGWMTWEYAALPVYAVEAVLALYPGAFVDVPDSQAVADLREGIAALGRIVVDHDVRCGVPRAEAVQNFQRTISYAYGIKSVGVGS